jgi:hypothetical protein
VTGVATTFLATLDVLRQAVASGKYFVITHEPTFYNHVDDTKRFESDEVVVANDELGVGSTDMMCKLSNQRNQRSPSASVTAREQTPRAGT